MIEEKLIRIFILCPITVIKYNYPVRFQRFEGIYYTIHPIPPVNHDDIEFILEFLDLL